MSDHCVLWLTPRSCVLAGRCASAWWRSAWPGWRSVAPRVHSPPGPEPPPRAEPTDASRGASSSCARSWLWRPRWERGGATPRSWRENARCVENLKHIKCLIICFGAAAIPVIEWIYIRTHMHVCFSFVLWFLNYSLKCSCVNSRGGFPPSGQ